MNWKYSHLLPPECHTVALRNIMKSWIWCQTGTLRHYRQCWRNCPTISSCSIPVNYVMFCALVSWAEELCQEIQTQTWWQCIPVNHLFAKSAYTLSHFSCFIRSNDVLMYGVHCAKFCLILNPLHQNWMFIAIWKILEFKLQLQKSRYMTFGMLQIFNVEQQGFNWDTCHNP